MKTLKLTSPNGTNLYRFDVNEALSLPTVIQAFNKDPQIRSIEGRWSSCPNINIAIKIRRTI